MGKSSAGIVESVRTFSGLRPRMAVRSLGMINSCSPAAASFNARV